MRRILALTFSFVLASAAALASSGITVDVEDAQLGDVVALLAAQSGRNVVTDSSIKSERITVHLHGVTFEEALAAISQAHGLTLRHEGSILIVGSSGAGDRSGEPALLSLRHARVDDVAKELTDALPTGTAIVPDKRTASILITADPATVARARRLVAILDAPHAADDEELTTISYRLRYLKPDEAMGKVKATIPSANVVADQEQNAVLITGPEAAQLAAKRVLDEIDVASPQVMFEVKVADVTPVNDSSDVGLEFGGLDLSGQPLAGAAAYAFTGGTIPVNVTLNLLVSKGRAQILATPKLVTINNKEADLNIGETYPIVYSTSVLGGQNVQYVDIGVHLRVTPTIGTDGSVTAELHPEYSELIGFTSTGYPIVANRKIDSTLRVADNQTIVLGGLLRETSSETISKVPGLGDIPIIGGLFKNKQSSHERDEIVFLITPHVIYPGTPPPQR